MKWHDKHTKYSSDTLKGLHQLLEHRCYLYENIDCIFAVMILFPDDVSCDGKYRREDLGLVAKNQSKYNAVCKILQSSSLGNLVSERAEALMKC